MRSVAWIVGAVVAVGCGGKKEAGQEACEDFTEAWCNWAIECEPTYATLLFAGEADSCSEVATEFCSDSGDDDDTGGEDDCVIENPPSEAMINACISSISSADCSSLTLDGPNTPECNAVIESLECEEPSTDGGSFNMDGGVTPGDAAAPPPIDASNIEVDTTGCMAAIELMCDTWADCSSPVGDNCPTFYDNNQSTVMAACTSYLQVGIATSVPLACWLNDQTAASIEDCLTFECGTGEYAAAASAYLSDQSEENLEALLELVLGNCDLSGAICDP